MRHDSFGEFHDSEFEKFMEETDTVAVTGNDLFDPFCERITIGNILNFTIGSRRKIRNYHDSKGVCVGKGSVISSRRDF